MVNLDFIKPLIEKMETLETIISILVSLLFSVFVNNDIVWVAICFCTCYLLTISIKGIVKFCKHKLGRMEDARQHDQRSIEEEYKIREYNTVFESLSKDYKRILIDLYRFKKPEGGFENQRVLPFGTKLNGEVTSVCSQLNNTFWSLELLQVTNSIGSTIVMIDRYFYEVLKENSKTFSIE